MLQYHTEIGTRPENQDQGWGFTSDAHSILMVADGHGKEGGQVAVKIAEECHRSSSFLLNQKEEFIQWAKNLSRRLKSITAGDISSGSTFSLLYCGPSGFGTVQLGDSPIYWRTTRRNGMTRGHCVDYTENQEEVNECIERGGGLIRLPWNGQTYLGYGKGNELLKLTGAFGDMAFGRVLRRDPVINFYPSADERLWAAMVASDGYNGEISEFLDLTKTKQSISSFREAQASRKISDNLTLTLLYS